MIGKNLRKTIQQLHLMFCMPKKGKNISCLFFSKIMQIGKSNLSFKLFHMERDGFILQ